MKEGLAGSRNASTILAPDEPPPLAVHCAGDRSPFLLIGDHAGRRIPESLGNLGLSAPDLDRHIAWDIGVETLGQRLADRLGTSFMHQRYSRLVIDCNRAPGAPDSIPPVSDGTAIPGNSRLDPAGAERRVEAIHVPYHSAIAAELDRRARLSQPTILVALHSFTPVWQGFRRPWQVGILHDAGDPAFALAVLAALEERSDLTVGDNEPYAMDSIDYTVPRHAYPRALPYVEIEIRQGLLGDAEGIERWTDIVEAALKQAARSEAADGVGS